MTSPQHAQGSLALLIRELLDKGYQEVAVQVLDDINGRVRGGVVAMRIAQLKEEAQRLAESGQVLRPDNPVLRALLADVEGVSARVASRLDVAAEGMVEQGAQSAENLTRRIAFAGLDGERFASIAMRWNAPDPEAVRAVLDYVNKQAWRDELSALPGRVIEAVNQKIVAGIVQGWNPVRTATLIADVIPGVTMRQAQTWLRTIQLTGYRDATALHHAANRHLIETIIRIAALDARTCMSCVNLHGSVLQPGQRVDDHHNGRCTSIAILKGSNRTVRRGEGWFRGLPEARQIAQMGAARWRAWQDGAFAFEALSRTYDDPVFGAMIGEASLKGILGDGAKQYYR